MQIKIQLPNKLKNAFNTPARFRVFHGGRGSAKSWSVAQMLIIRAAKQKTRILCARELQKSIKDSSLKILGDTIYRLGLQGEFDIGETYIRHSYNGSEFMFKGIKANPDEIKSTEGIDIAWVEEAHRISKKSIDILIPTVRAEGSEIWFTYNPDDEEDEVHQRFVVNDPPPHSIVIEINYYDNPWFPKELEDERIFCQTNDPDNYKHIWEGKTKEIKDGHVYAKEISRAKFEGRIGIQNLWEESKGVRTAWDIGATDATAIWFYQFMGGMIHVIDYYESEGEDPRDLVKLVNSKPYNYDKHVLPHDADHKKWTQDGIMTAQKMLSGLGLSNTIIQSRTQSERDDIFGVKMKFNKCVFDEKCAYGVKMLKQLHRKYNEDRKTFSEQIVHDYSSHGGAGFRYLIVDSYNNTHEKKPRPVDTQPTFNDMMTSNRSNMSSKRM